MSCKLVEVNFDEYLSGELPVKDAVLIKNHVHQCEICQRSINEHQKYLSKMKAFSASLAPRNDLALTIRRAKQEAKRSHQKNFSYGNFFQGFVAASLLVFAFVLFGKFNAPINVNLMTSDRHLVKHDVHVLIYVPTDIDDAQLALKLPEYMALSGYEDMQTIKWKTNLVEGANQLVLPVYLEPGVDLNKKHMIAASIGYKNKTKEFQLYVDLKPARINGQGANANLIEAKIRPV